MKPRPLFFRKTADYLMRLLASSAAVLGLVQLGWILSTVIQRGLLALGWDFFFHLPTPPMVPGGGVANAILGSLVITLLATIMAVPLGLLAGIGLAEFGGGRRYADWCRLAANILGGIPSIIVGVFVYGILVVTTGTFSAWAGATALAIIMLPVVARTTEDMLQLIPDALRESGLALGCPYWRLTLAITLRAAKSGIITGVLLAVARVAGETAPLLFTALNSPFMFHSLWEPTPNLTVTIFNYAMSPFADWQQKAWGAALLITMAVLCLNLATRFLWREKKT